MGVVLLIATVGALLVFFLGWCVCVRINNYGYLDVIWSLSVAVLAPLYAVFGTGDVNRRIAFALIGALWSLRLGGYIAIRVTRHHPHEDKRYETLRAKWSSPVKFLLFFELQALIAVLFSLPFLLASFNSRAQFSLPEVAGLGIALLATCGEWLADWQAQHFKRSSPNTVIDRGLWRYSRHPNYFFESLVWWGFFVAALGTPWGWITLICPLLMLYLLLNVTGIPLTEKHSVQNRGDAYRRYQQTTSRFIPWFKRA